MAPLPIRNRKGGGTVAALPPSALIGFLVGSLAQGAGEPPLPHGLHVQAINRLATHARNVDAVIDNYKGIMVKVSPAFKGAEGGGGSTDFRPLLSHLRPHAFLFCRTHHPLYCCFL